MNIYLLVPLVIIGVVYLAFLIYDIFKHKETKLLPWWLWLIISCVSVPFGGVLYLLIGRE